MYYALYRKYRPQTFDDVIGQQVIIKTLKNSIINNKISHAYLFTGPRGCGKTTIAKILAQTINCQNLQGSEQCGECVFCTQLKEKKAIDIIEIDAASNNGVDEIREINNKVNLVPAVGKYKVYIIDEVHMLTIGAFNALLKTLEEPPSHVVFILATTEPHKIPVTILSRCQRYDFKKISEKEIANRIKYIVEQEQIEIDETAIFEISRLGDGSLRDAISILDQVNAYADNKITIQDIHDVNGTLPQIEINSLIQNIIKHNANEVFNQLDSYITSGKNISKILDEIILYFRNILIFKNANEYFKNNNIDNIYSEIANEISNEKLDKFIEILLDTVYKIKKTNNTKLLVEICLIKLMDLENQNKVSTEIINKDYIKQEKIEEAKKQPLKEETKNKEIINKEKPKNNIDLKELEEFKQIRINNILSEFNKKTTLEIKKQLEFVNDYLLDDKFSKAASILLDGELKAASSYGLIFVYNNDNLSNEFNEKITIIEELIFKIFSVNYKVISTTKEDWEIIKTKFNNNKSSFVYKEETCNIEDIIKKIRKENNIDDITSIFGDIVEYN